ncbi:hydroxyphenylacetyl-CoA thioesterase PaaI [Microbacterium sp. ASV49]|uniref:Hydroxyphenylacetyl-CoA thioesterase PaaI n=1 Tax=Microbacterium candidum TaxID=3041922 RepID=A0ABT7N0E3_9MICO|nr:hydroxyphenylacetyl-CoA thioesterase PaaI [Microbacterium sp. ASV49]MDL9980173.1 hydroxyphenylacetyl-CoA thioesterase PaaI [Microbacterium sp. ASV49]
MDDVAGDVFATAHARDMIAADRASAALGIEVVSAAPGEAVVRMPVRADMLNGFHVIHGGLVFAVADTAFALACNETDAVTLAAGADIAFLTSAREGEVLTAVAQRRSLVGRSGIYDVRVEADDGRIVAEFRGRSLTTRRPVPDRFNPEKDMP